MSNWYSKIDINLKNNKDKKNTNRVLDFLKSKYDFSDLLIEISEDKLEFNGKYRGSSLTKNGRLPEVEELFTDICLAVDNCDIESSLFYECSMEDGFNEYKLDFHNNNIIITFSPFVWNIPYYDFESYEEYSSVYGEDISKEEFQYAISSKYIYLDEKHNYYTEEDFQKSFCIIYSKKMDEIKNQEANRQLSNRNDVLKAIKNDPKALKNASKELRKDKEIVLKSIKYYPSSFEYASEELKKDKDVVLEVIKSGPYLLQDINDDLKNDKEIVSEAVKQNGLLLEYASDNLRGDKDIIIESLKSNPNSYQYVIKELQNSKDIIIEAIKICTDYSKKIFFQLTKK